MPGRSQIFRAAAIVVLIAVVIAALAAVHRRTSTPAVGGLPTISSSTPDDLPAELRRCSTLGPQDAEDAHCAAVWKENRRRFFGRPARALPPRSPSGITAPATSPSGGVR